MSASLQDSTTGHNYTQAFQTKRDIGEHDVRLCQNPRLYPLPAALKTPRLTPRKSSGRCYLFPEVDLGLPEEIWFLPYPSFSSHRLKCTTSTRSGLVPSGR